MTNLNKADLVKALASATGSTQGEAAGQIDTIFQTIQSALKSGGKVQIHGFGTFTTKERAARTGRNPATGATIQIAASTSVKFKPVSNFLS